MTVPVAWMPLGPAGPPSRGSQWDEAMLDAALSGALWRPAGGPAFAHQDGLGDVDGAVVVVPGRYWATDAEALTRRLAGLSWALVVLASDEESSFPWRDLVHPRMRLWVMTPRPGVHRPASPVGDGPVRYLGEGWPHRTPQTLSWYFGPEARDRPLDWYFAGQVTHERRVQCRDALAATAGPATELVQTRSFAAGVAQKEYLRGLASAKVAPCPSGPVTPDSFRLYEALEAGCVPVADGHCPGYAAGGYWPLVLGEDPPFPVVEAWDEWPSVLESVLDGWAAKAAACSAWWQGHKRRLAYDLSDDVTLLAGTRRRRAGCADSVTVVVTASPTPHDPGTDLVDAALASVRAYPALADAEAVVVCDGVRPGMEHRAAAWAETQRELAWRCEHEWQQTLPVMLPEWRHQAGAMAAALALVRTPLVLVVEHDTPMCGDVDWDAVARALLRDEVDLVRFYHEVAVHPEHAHLMLDFAPVDLGFPAVRTIQWSNRPHLATARYLRRVLADHFLGGHRRAFVEDVMHGEVQHAYARDGFAGWRRHRLALYAPPGDIKRSLHLDGRGTDEKAPGWVD